MASTYVENNFVDVRIGNDTSSMKHICKSLDMHFISIKNHETEHVGTFLFQVRESLLYFQGRVPKLFYLQGRASSNIK